MVNSNGQCHFCKHEIESRLHLFYRRHQIKHVLDELKHIFKIILFLHSTQCKELLIQLNS
jgi:hypothetical protein